MTLILAFSPFILFAVLSRLSADLALWAAFAAAFVVTIRDFVESPSLRLLDVTNLVLFGALALIRGFMLPGLSLVILRFAAELVLLAVLAASLIRKKPFSLDYAHDVTHGRNWEPRAFWRVNARISLAWTCAFAAMAIADGALLLDSRLPIVAAVAVSVVALGAAITFTLRYPAHVLRRKQA